MGPAPPAGVVTGLAAAGLTLSAGRMLQRRAEHAAAALPPRGLLVDVGETRLHVTVAGMGPVVVLEAGAGGTLDSWDLVSPLLADHSTVVAYDRPGLGFSPDGSATDRRPLAVARRLHALLEVLELPGPYVLVGHSAGALHVRAFAAQQPESVRGLVLVDPSHEQMSAALATVPMPLRLAGTVLGAALRAAAIGAPVGTHRLLEPLTSVAPIARRHGLDPRPLVLNARTARAVRAQAAERHQVAASLEQMLALGPPRVPCTVLSGDRFAGRTREARCAVNDLHASLTAAAPEGRHTVVADCGHLIPLEAPHAVADAVLERLRRPG